MLLIIGLFLLGAAIFFAEIFLPAGGILGTFGAISLLTSAFLAFKHYGPLMGLSVTLAALVAMAGLIMLGLQMFPKTPIGRQLTQPGTITGIGPVAAPAELMGKTGIALTTLRPSGQVEIDGQRYDVVSDGPMIQKGTAIVVKQVERFRVVVIEKKP